MKNKFLEYYPFWLGLIVCIFLMRWSTPTFAILFAFILGYYKLTKLH